MGVQPTATFNKAMDPLTLTALTFTVLQGATPVAGTVSYKPATKTATFKPALPLAKGLLYEAGEFLQVHAYTNVVRWAERLYERPAVRRGRMVNRVQGDPASQLHERHDASDFDLKTQDKVAP